MAAVTAALLAARCCCALLRWRLLWLAQVSSYGEKQTGPAQRQAPAILNGVGIAQHLNQQLPLDLTFTDDTGKQVQLGSYFGKTSRHSCAGLLPMPHALL